MRGPLYLLLLLATWTSTGQAQDADSLTVIAKLPNCAVYWIRSREDGIWLTLIATMFGDCCCRLTLPTYELNMYMYQR
jgi:hypothetical protein